MSTKLSYEPLGDRIVPALTSFTYEISGEVRIGFLDYEDSLVDPGSPGQQVPLTSLYLAYDGDTVTTVGTDPGATAQFTGGHLTGVSFQVSDSPPDGEPDRVLVEVDSGSVTPLTTDQPPLTDTDADLPDSLPSDQYTFLFVMPDGRAGFGSFALPADQLDPGAASQVLELADLAFNFDGFTLGSPQFDTVPLAHLENGQVTGISFSLSNPPAGFPYPNLTANNGVIGAAMTQISITSPENPPPVPPPQIDTTAVRDNYLRTVVDLNTRLRTIKDKVAEIQAVQADIIRLYNDLRNATTDAERRAILTRGAALVQDMRAKQEALRPLVVEYSQRWYDASLSYRTLKAVLPSEQYIMLPPPPFYLVPPGVLPLPDA